VKETTKNARHDAAIAELLGISVEEVQSQRVKEERDAKAREAQAVLLFLEHPDKFMSKFCDKCHQIFMTSYQFVSVCSSKCRIAALADVGIDWNPMRTADERWKRAQIPVDYTIPPDALAILMQLAQSQSEAPNQDQVVLLPPSENGQGSQQSKTDSHTDLEIWLDELDPLEVEENEISLNDAL